MPVAASLLLACASLAGSIPAPAGSDPVLGEWLTENGRARVEISRDGDSVSGRIVWLKEPVYPPDDPEGMGGRAIVDRYHPDPGRRGRPVLGLEILWGFEPDGDGRWKGGRVYDPESGKTYKARLRLSDPAHLELRGYVGIPLFGRTSRWQRAARPLPARDAPSTASGPAP